MRIGVPTETKVHEYRVGATPAGVAALVRAGHDVLVQTGAGAGSRIDDAEYAAAGARIVPAAADAWSADLVVKVKEPTPAEFAYLRPDLTVFAYLHLAADPALAAALMRSGCAAFAFETVRSGTGALPLLAPMSQVAGRLAVTEGAHHLLRFSGGRGLVVGGVPGVPPARVVVLGAGVAGSHATAMAVGLGAEVTVLDVDQERLAACDARYAGRVRTVTSNATAVTAEVLDADLVIGSVLVPGARAPRLVSSELIEQMRDGAVLVDIAIDQGGCFEPSRPTTHADPVFEFGGCLLYCVANMPGAAPRTSTFALANATGPLVEQLAASTWRDAARTSALLRGGLNVAAGRITCRPVAEALTLEATAVDEVLS